jgi:hypothetical protein
MNASDILAEFEALDASLYLEDGAIRWDAPRGAIPPELLAAARDRKPDLIALLSGHLSRDGRCVCCGQAAEAGDRCPHCVSHSRRAEREQCIPHVQAPAGCWSCGRDRAGGDYLCPADRARADVHLHGLAAHKPGG